VHYHLGVAYSQAKQIEKAKKSLRQALAMKKDFEGAADARKVLAELGG
jgi:Tfp pilus assembly protein PilF